MSNTSSFTIRPRNGMPGDASFAPPALHLGELVIGAGQPKIIVPITGKSSNEALHIALQIAGNNVADLAEFRIDYLPEAADPVHAPAVAELCKKVRETLGGKPLLVTFRTQTEGGQRALSDADYEHLYQTIIEANATDLIDLQMMIETPRIQRLVELAHARGIAVVMSNHNFDETPSNETLIERLRHQQTLGADILKIAAMPKNAGDTLRLMQATWDMYSRYAERPLLTMSMGGAGVVSRVSGELTGSALSYGSMGTASAPGQLDVQDLHNILQIIQASAEN